MYRTILVPLDGSERAEQVLPHMLEFARKEGTDLLLMHVVEPPTVAMPMVGHGVPTAAPMMVSLEDAVARTQQEAKDYLQRVSRRLAEQGIACETVLAQGGVVQQIVQVAEERDADLIGMTSHGRTGLGTAFFGSVALGVLHRVARPVLLIRARD